jgi:hypothetical protein
MMTNTVLSMFGDEEDVHVSSIYILGLVIVLFVLAYIGVIHPT